MREYIRSGRALGPDILGSGAPFGFDTRYPSQLVALVTALRLDVLRFHGKATAVIAETTSRNAFPERWPRLLDEVWAVVEGGSRADRARADACPNESGPLRFSQPSRSWSPRAGWSSLSSASTAFAQLATSSSGS
jgi:hypothetical protein